MIYACEHHDQLLGLWREQNRRGLRLAHVDFHDDLRGLLIHRRRGRAYALGALAHGEAPVDSGNFLAHGVLEGRVERIRWVHDLPGGRAWDLGIVRYESDLLAWPRRLRRALGGGPEVELEFEEILLDHWPGLDVHEQLSVDWDCFASRLQDPSGIERRVEKFLERVGPNVPADSYLVYSPEYSHPTLELFNGFVEHMATRFDQPVDWLSPGLPRGELQPSDLCTRLDDGLLTRLTLFLRRRGIF